MISTTVDDVFKSFTSTVTPQKKQKLRRSGASEDLCDDEPTPDTKVMEGLLSAIIEDNQEEFGNIGGGDGQFGSRSDVPGNTGPMVGYTDISEEDRELD